MIAGYMSTVAVALCCSEAQCCVEIWLYLHPGPYLASLYHCGDEILNTASL